MADGACYTIGNVSAKKSQPTHDKPGTAYYYLLFFARKYDFHLSTGFFRVECRRFEMPLLTLTPLEIMGEMLLAVLYDLHCLLNKNATPKNENDDFL